MPRTLNLTHRLLRIKRTQTSRLSDLSRQDLFSRNDNVGFFTSRVMMNGQFYSPARLRLYKLPFRSRLSAAERAEQERIAKHGIEWWASPNRTASVFSHGADRSGNGREKEQEPAGDLPTSTPLPAAHTPRRPAPTRDSYKPAGFYIRSVHTTLRSAPISPFRFPSGSSASFTNIAERRASELRGRIKADREVDLVQIMADLRDLELLDMLREAKPKAGSGYKDATRALYPLYHKLDQGQIERVTFGDLEAALPPIFTLPWTSISERLLGNQVTRLSGLSVKEKAALLFLQIYNIGVTRARKYAEAGCRTLEDLAKKQDTEKIKLTKAQKIGLKHREDINRLIPRGEVELIKQVLEKTLASIDPTFECEILGSYRRGVDFSSDIDLAVRTKAFVDKDNEETSKPIMARIVAELEKHKLISKENQLMFGPKKYAGLIQLPKHKHFRRIDIRLAPYHSYPYMLLGSTGDALLMKLLRHTAKQKGWCLNEYGMGDAYAKEDENSNGFKPNSLKIVKNEQEIFDLLGLPHLKPEGRELQIWHAKYAKAGVKAVDYLHKL